MAIQLKNEIIVWGMVYNECEQGHYAYLHLYIV